MVVHYVRTSVTSTSFGKYNVFSRKVITNAPNFTTQMKHFLHFIFNGAATNVTLIVTLIDKDKRIIYK